MKPLQWVRENYQDLYQLLEPIAEYIPDIHSKERSHFGTVAVAGVWDVWEQVQHELQAFESVAAQQDDWAALAAYLSGQQQEEKAACIARAKLGEFTLYFPLLAVAEVYRCPDNLLRLYLRKGLTSPFDMIGKLPLERRPALHLSSGMDLLYVIRLDQYELVDNLFQILATNYDGSIITIYAEKLGSSAEIVEEQLLVFSRLVRDTISLYGDFVRIQVTRGALSSLYSLLRPRAATSVLKAIAQLADEVVPLDNYFDMLSYSILVGRAALDAEDFLVKASWDRRGCLLSAFVTEDFVLATKLIKGLAISHTDTQVAMFEALRPSVCAYALQQKIHWDIRELIDCYSGRSYPWSAQRPSESLRVLLSCAPSQIKQQILDLGYEITRAFDIDLKGIIQLFLDAKIPPEELLGLKKLPSALIGPFLCCSIRIPLNQLPQPTYYTAKSILASRLYSLDEKLGIIRTHRARLAPRYLTSELWDTFVSDEERTVLTDALWSAES